MVRLAAVLLAVVSASCASDGAPSAAAPAESVVPITASAVTEAPLSAPVQRSPGLPGPRVDGVWESLDEADVAGWMTGFTFVDPPEHVYPIVTSTWGLAAGQLHIGDRTVNVTHDAVHPNGCPLLTILMNGWLPGWGEVPVCYVLAGLDSTGEVEWLRSFSGVVLGEWIPTVGFGEQFNPEPEVTVQVWDVIDGSVVVGPDEAAVAIPLSDTVTSDCLLEVDDPGLFFDEPNRVVMGVIDVASTEIVQIRCEQWWED